MKDEYSNTEKELENLVKISEQRELTVEELKRYYILHGVPDDFATAYAENGGRDLDVNDQHFV